MLSTERHSKRLAQVHEISTSKSRSLGIRFDGTNEEPEFSIRTDFPRIHFRGRERLLRDSGKASLGTAHWPSLISVLYVESEEAPWLL